jgi:uncharacterized alkaline shock family protein YloU
MALTGPTPTPLSHTDPNWTDPNRLGCGRSIDDLWARIDLPPDLHEQTCPDCQAARHDLGNLAMAMHDVIAADKADPTLRLNPAALTGIIETARAEVRRGRRIPMEPAQPGAAGDELTVSEQALANLIRRTSDAIDGLEARRCSVAPNEHAPLTTDPPVAGAGQLEPPPATAEIIVDLRISVDPTVAIPALTRLLRDRVRRAVEREVGIAATLINISVEDTYDV